MIGLIPGMRLQRLRYLLTREFIGQFLLFAAPIGFATAFAIFLFYHFDVQMVRYNLHETEEHHIHLRDTLIRSDVRTAATGLLLLARLHDSGADATGRQAPAAATLEREFRAFCDQFPSYLRIWSVDRNGRPGPHVHCRALRDGGRSEDAEVGIPPELWRQLRFLDQDEVYVSGFNGGLDTGSGATGESWPQVSFATSVAWPASAGGGYVVAQVSLRDLISDLMFDTGQGGRMMLVERSGRFTQKSTGEGRPDGASAPGAERTFAQLYPRIWQAMMEERRGVVEDAGGLFSFATVDLTEPGGTAAGRTESVPPLSLRAPAWWIVSHVDGSEIQMGRNDSLRRALFLIPAPFLVALYLAHVAVRRRRTARDLEETERYSREIMDSVVDGIVTTDDEGNIDRANAAMLTLFGMRSVSELPSNLFALLPPDKLDESEELARIWRTGEEARRPARIQLGLHSRDGREFPADVVVMGTVLGGERRFIWVIHDVSERSAFEAEQNAARMKFFHQTKMAEIGLIAAGIIHEVGNPIAAISGIVHDLDQQAAEGGSAWNQHLRERLGVISEQTRRLEGITREISDFVRSRPGVVELFDLNSLIRSTVRLVRYDARWKSVDVRMDLDASIPAIVGVQDQFAQLLMNLLVNAADAVQEQPTDRRNVSVRTESGQNHVVIRVEDSGHGMSEEIQKHAFDAFFTTKPEGKGTGLGLSLCKSIVMAHSGTIEVTSTEGQGATFHISLPVRQ